MEHLYAPVNLAVLFYDILYFFNVLKISQDAKSCLNFCFFFKPSMVIWFSFGCLGYATMLELLSPSQFFLVHSILLALQDVACELLGRPARDVARHCVERWNHARRVGP